MGVYIGASKMTTEEYEKQLIDKYTPELDALHKESIEDAKQLLTENGFSILQWQTGEPELNKKIIAVSDGEYVLLTREKSLVLPGRCVYINQNTGKIYHKDFYITEWAYLSKKEQRRTIMTREHFFEIMNDEDLFDMCDYNKDTIFEGILIMKKYLPDTNCISFVSGDIIYGVKIDDLYKVITKEDTEALRKLGWAVDDGEYDNLMDNNYVCYFT